MRYNVAQLIKGPTGASRIYDLNERIDDLDPGLMPVCPLLGVVSLLRTSQGILVTGKLRTTLRTTCRRCLEPCDSEIEIDLEEEFLPVAPVGGAPLDVVPSQDRDETLVIHDDHILDLQEVIRQQLWLTMPMEAVCRPDCAGLCPRCGGNRNLGECTCEQPEIDPRWEALRAFQVDGSESEERSN